MTRRKLLMGNWKMYKTVAEARSFAETIGKKTSVLADSVDYSVCPPFTALQALRVILPAQVKLGAQNVHFEKEGAFTGEVSADMLKELGVTYVIVGHSERRHVFGETDDFIRQKVNAVVNAGMTPVLCVGEDQRERQIGHTERVVEKQTLVGLSDLTPEQAATAVIAYEPVWAIGTGLTPTTEDAQQVIQGIRQVVAKEKGQAAAESVRILYGGSVKPGNIAGFTNEPDIDGALVGGASLDADSFAAMAEAVNGGGH